MELGQKFKQIRKQRKYTIQRLSQVAGSADPGRVLPAEPRPRTGIVTPTYHAYPKMSHVIPLRVFQTLKITKHHSQMIRFSNF